MNLRSPVAALAALTTLAVTGLVGAQAVQQASAATVGTGRVTQTVNARQLPHLNGPITGSLSTGRSVRIVCQTYGDTVYSPFARANTNLWSYTPDIDAFVSDGFLDTGVNGRIPGVPLCQNVGAKPGDATVKAAATELVNVRRLPYLTGTINQAIPAGRQVTVVCQTYGDTVFSRFAQANTNLWSYSPELGGFVSDGSLDTGVNGRVPGVPLCKDVGGRPTPAAPAKKQIVPVRQGQGQDQYQWYDCGPAAVVSSLLALGRTPHAWDPNNQGAAIMAARRDMAYAPPARLGTLNVDVERAMGTYGVPTRRTTDVEAVLAHVRSGKPAMLMGELQVAAWPVNVATTDPILHWMVIADYDATNDEYLVIDPASRPETNTVHRAKASWVRRYHAQNPGEGGVLLG